MKAIRFTSCLGSLTAFSVFVCEPATLHGQGSLTPPGSPAPTMKTLDQIEPRIPIDTVPIIITNPGSYYLTTNLLAPPATSGVTLRTNDIALDLNGFALVGGGSAGNGVATPLNLANLVFRNGAILI